MNVGASTGFWAWPQDAPGWPNDGAADDKPEKALVVLVGGGCEGPPENGDLPLESGSEALGCSEEVEA